VGRFAPNGGETVGGRETAPEKVAAPWTLRVIE
jgi:hypothetical protein